MALPSLRNWFWVAHCSAPLSFEASPAVSFLLAKAFLIRAIHFVRFFLSGMQRRPLSETVDSTPRMTIEGPSSSFSAAMELTPSTAFTNLCGKGATHIHARLSSCMQLLYFAKQSIAVSVHSALSPDQKSSQYLPNGSFNNFLPKYRSREPDTYRSGLHQYVCGWMCNAPMRSQPCTLATLPNGRALCTCKARTKMRKLWRHVFNSVPRHEELL